MSGTTRWAVVTPGEVAGEPVQRARGARMAVLIRPQQGAQRFITRRFTLAPGGDDPGAPARRG